MKMTRDDLDTDEMFRDRMIAVGEATQKVISKPEFLEHVKNSLEVFQRQFKEIDDFFSKVLDDSGDLTEYAFRMKLVSEHLRNLRAPSTLARFT